MKTNDRLLLAAVAAYSYLFYEQNAGINFLIFNILLVGIMAMRNQNLLRDKRWLFSSGLCVITSLAVFVNSSALAIITNVFSLLLFSAYSCSTKTSALFSMAFSGWSVVTSFV